MLNGSNYFVHSPKEYSGTGREGGSLGLEHTFPNFPVLPGHMQRYLG